MGEVRTSQEKSIMQEISRLNQEEFKNKYKIKRMVDDVRSSQNGSRTKGLNDALSRVEIDNNMEVSDIREMMSRNKEKIREQMEIDYKIEREMINLQECGSDEENPKYKQIQKRIKMLRKSKDQSEG